MFLIANKFIAVQCNIPNCQTCSVPNVCSVCNNGYNLVQNGICIGQFKRLYELSNDATRNNVYICMLFYSLKYIVFNEPFQCPAQCSVANCQSCLSPNSCVLCNSGFILNSDNTCTSECPSSRSTVIIGRCVWKLFCNEMTTIEQQLNNNLTTIQQQFNNN